MTVWPDSDKEASDHQAFQFQAVHRPSIDEVDIPIPINDQYEDYSDRGASSEVENEADDDHTSGPVLFHRRTAVLGSGVVKLIAPSRHILLRFRLGNKVAKRILGLAKDPTIHFSPQEVDLRIDDHIIYRNPIERLLASVEGAEWLIQIVHELEALKESWPQQMTQSGNLRETSLQYQPKIAISGLAGRMVNFRSFASAASFHALR
ncbi:hypothetical protein VTN77DRAFT_8641 [Rasamsonia byssochlamydoides]|uniref:uncharacterized protein n=1 Tax=Rasamsonia byssochlamydoides TaxID=89139 RepID=UPI0037449A40